MPNSLKTIIDQLYSNSYVSYLYIQLIGLIYILLRFALIFRPTRTFPSLLQLFSIRNRLFDCIIRNRHVLMRRHYSLRLIHFLRIFIKTDQVNFTITFIKEFMSPFNQDRIQKSIFGIGCHSRQICQSGSVPYLIYCIYSSHRRNGSCFAYFCLCIHQ